MHHDKVSIGNAVGGRLLLDHDKRSDVDRDALRDNKKIDPSLAHLNRDLSVHKMTPSEAWRHAKSVAENHSKTKTGKRRKLRDNTVIMSMDVLHLPDNWDEVTNGADPMEYFERVALPFERMRYGRDDLENEISAVVHRDEKLVSAEEYAKGVRPGRDHLHYKYVPITKDGKLSHKEVNNRADLKSYHRDLLAFAEAQGYHGLHIYEDAPEKGKAKAQSMPEYQATQQEIERAKAVEKSAKTSAKQAIEQMQEAQANVDSLRKQANIEAERLEGLQQERERAEKRVAVLETIAAECRSADAAPIGSKGRFFDSITSRCTEWLKKLGVTVRAAASHAADKLTIRLRGSQADAGIRETSARTHRNAGPVVVAPTQQPQKEKTL